jgi:hypothetical protein
MLPYPTSLPFFPPDGSLSVIIAVVLLTQAAALGALAAVDLYGKHKEKAAHR